MLPVIPLGRRVTWEHMPIERRLRSGYFPGRRGDGDGKRAEVVRTRQRSLRNGVSRKLAKGIRRSGATYSYVVADRLDFLNTDDWDAMTAGQSLFLSRGYQEVLQDAGPRALTTRYGLVYSGKEVIAAVVAHLLGVPSDAMGEHVLSNMEQSDSEPDWLYRVPATSRKRQRILLCGDFFAGGFHGAAVHPDADMGLLWPAITGFLERVHLQEGLVPDVDSVLIKDVQSTLAFDTRALRSCHYQRLNANSTMVLSMPERWKTYNDYLENLNVRHRMGAYRVARDLNRAHIQVQRMRDVSPHASRMHTLYQAIQQNKRRVFATLPEAFLPALGAELGDGGFRCTGLFLNGELDAFVFTVRDRDTAVCFCLGWDRERCVGLPVLPALLHAVIEDALNMGCRRIDFGRTALKAKAQVGAHPQASEIWARQSALGVPENLQAALEPLTHTPNADPVLTFSQS